MKFRSFEDYRAHVGRVYVDGGALTRQVGELDSEIQEAEQALTRLRTSRADVAAQLEDIIAEQNRLMGRTEAAEAAAAAALKNETERPLRDTVTDQVNGVDNVHFAAAKSITPAVSPTDWQATFGGTPSSKTSSPPTEPQTTTGKRSRGSLQSAETLEPGISTTTTSAKKPRKAATDGRKKLIEMEKESPFRNGQVKAPTPAKLEDSDEEDIV